MATATTVHPSKVELSPSTAGIFHTPQITPDSAKSASQLLQENHVKHHIFFNQSGFHNHIAHHLLTIYSLGATPGQIQHGYAANANYQRPQLELKSDVLKQMTESRSQIPGFYGKEKYYHDFMEFFVKELEKKGTKSTLDEWLFKRDEVAEGLLTRMFAGFYHPIIHFGFGLEFHQPAILSESLAQGAIHDNWVSPFLLGCEKSAGSNKGKSVSLIQLLREARDNDTIRNSPHPDDGNKTRDGVVGRAGKEMIEVASKWTVAPTRDDLRYKTAEMVQLCAYFTAGAMNPRKIPKFDFFYMHCINASIFHTAFLEDKQCQEIFGDDPGRKNLVRLLEMKGRTDLTMYISRGSPELDMDRVKNYEPKHPEQGWSEIFQRVCSYEDDGHAAKLVRAMANGERVCREYEDKEDWPVKGDMWLKIGHMVIDSVEAPGPRWVRGAGWEKEWNEVPDRKDVKL